MYVATKNGIFFNKKVIVSGSMIEVYFYERAVKAGYQESRKKARIEKEIKKEEKEENDFALRRARSNIRRLIAANFNKKYDKFITLTFKENMQDITKANKEFTNFIKRLKRRFAEQEIKYLTVIEFQKRGAIHYHTIANLPYVENKELSKMWGNGFVKINAIENIDNVSTYISKYLTKETYDNEKMKNKKKYFPSRNLKRPKVLVGDEAESMLNKIKNQKIVYESTYNSEYNGKIVYIQYNIDENII